MSFQEVHPSYTSLYSLSCEHFALAFAKLTILECPKGASGVAHLILRHSHFCFNSSMHNAIACTHCHVPILLWSQRNLQCRIASRVHQERLTWLFQLLLNSFVHHTILCIHCAEEMLLWLTPNSQFCSASGLFQESYN